MCRICDGDYPTEPTERVLKLAELADKVDHFGAMHIVIEDGNVEPRDIEVCMEDTGATEDDLAFGRMALTMTEDEILSAIAKHDKLW